MNWEAIGAIVGALALILTLYLEWPGIRQRIRSKPKRSDRPDEVSTTTTEDGAEIEPVSIRRVIGALLLNSIIVGVLVYAILKPFPTGSPVQYALVMLLKGCTGVFVFLLILVTFVPLLLAFFGRRENKQK